MRKIAKNPTSPVNQIAAANSYTEIQNSINQGSFNSKVFQQSIYGSPAVKSQLLIDQHNKCAYCEKTLEDEKRDVEHFRPKTECQQQKGSPVFRGYWWLAYDWDNLLYSCQVCNESHKLNFFPLNQPHSADPTPQSVVTENPLLINPNIDDPKDFIYFDKNVVFAKNNSRKGQTTIDVLGLNRKELKDDRRLDRWKEFLLCHKILKKINPSNPDYNQAKQEIQDMFFSDASEYVGMFENQLNPINL